MSRGQSHVVGVALLLGVTILALGGLTVGVGGLLDAQAAHADSQRVADGLTSALDAVETTGYRRVHVGLTRGSLDTERRTVRIYRNGSLAATVDAGGLVYEAGTQRVAYVGGAVVVGRGESTWLASEPPVAGSASREVLVLGVPRLNASDRSVSGAGGARIPITTNVSHDRRDLGRGRFAIAIETATPEPFERHFAERGASTTRVDPDGDGLQSVRATYPGVRRAYLVTHDLSLEVGHG